VQQTLGFAVGEYQTSKLSGRSVLSFGYPVLNQAGRLQAVVSAGLDLEKLNQHALVTPLPEGAVVAVVDRHSTVLLQYPTPKAWVGKSFPDAQINRKVLTRTEGTITALGIDGVERLYAFSRLGNDPVNGSISIRIGIPTLIAFAPANKLLTQNLIGLGVVALLALAAAWFGGDWFLVRKVKSLVKTTERLRQGDLAARTTISDEGELGLLARSFNDMASVLEKREQAIARLNHDLQLQLIRLQTTQNNLEASEARLQLALNTGHMGTWEWNTKTDAIIWSEGHFRLLGLEPYECEPSYALWASHIHPEDSAATEAALTQAQTQVREYRAEYRVVQQDGTIVWVESRGGFELDSKGQPTDSMIGVIVDVSDRKQIELELRQKNAILDVVNESAPAPIFVKDRQGRIIYANPATLEVLGKSADEVIGYRDGDLYPNFEDAARVMENDRRIMESGEMEVVEESPDGIRTFLGMKVPYRNEAGEVIGLIGISNDITDRVQLERDRERLLQREQVARAAAETANRIKDEFLAVLSHELRTPMNPILGWAKLLRNGKLNDTKVTLAIETIERNAQLQVQLIDDLLDISRILQGKLSLSSTPIQLSTVLRAAIETVRLAAEAKALSIQPLFPSSDLVVQGDGGRLQQVIWNLLANAVKFTPPGGQVEVELSQVEMNAQIQVRDTGKGIKPEFLPYVFEHFRQEDGATTRKFGGLGLGLAIARQIVELHGGQIRVESLGEDQGAIFTVQIPLASQLAQSVVPEPAPVSALDLSGLQILVVDDEPDSRDFVTFVLEQAGAIVTRAASGSEAFRQLEQFAFDVIISDIGMPEMDGYQLMQQVRSMPQVEPVPAIALTAYAGEYDRQKALKVGFQEHLAKPVEPEALVEAIVALVGTQGGNVLPIDRFQ
jgi:PAS domain S-box-containing protein